MGFRYNLSYKSTGWYSLAAFFAFLLLHKTHFSIISYRQLKSQSPEPEAERSLSLRPVWFTKWVRGQQGTYKGTLSQKNKQNKKVKVQRLSSYTVYTYTVIKTFHLIFQMSTR